MQKKILEDKTQPRLDVLLVMLVIFVNRAIISQTITGQIHTHVRFAI